MTTQFDLLRHGHCDGGQIFRGHHDSHLSQLGQQQMQQALSQYMPRPAQQQNSVGWDVIICSPSLRCHNFAQQLSRQLSIPLIAAPALKEIFFGDWEGQSIEALHRAEPALLENFWRDPVKYPPPNGESMTEFFNRVDRYWQSLLGQQRGKKCLLISHGGSIRCILASVLGMSLRPLSRLSVPHACLSRIEIFHQNGSEDWPQLSFHQPLAEQQSSPKVSE